jgi:hypothetical protein
MMPSLAMIPGRQLNRKAEKKGMVDDVIIAYFLLQLGDAGSKEQMGRKSPEAW